MRASKEFRDDFVSPCSKRCAAIRFSNTRQLACRAPSSEREHSPCRMNRQPRAELSVSNSVSRYVVASSVVRLSSACCALCAKSVQTRAQSSLSPTLVRLLSMTFASQACSMQRISLRSCVRRQQRAVNCPRTFSARTLDSRVRSGSVESLNVCRGGSEARRDGTLLAHTRSLRRRNQTMLARAAV
jgi:hypothetical protein